MALSRLHLGYVLLAIPLVLIFVVGMVRLEGDMLAIGSVMSMGAGVVLILDEHKLLTPLGIGSSSGGYYGY